MAKRESPRDPWSYVWSGVGLSILAGFLFAFAATDDEWSFAALIGFVAAVAGGVFFMVGVVAAGVMVAHENIDFWRRTRERIEAELDAADDD